MKDVYSKYLLSLLLFGSNGIVASAILLNSYEIVLFRTLIGSLFLILVFIASKQKFQCFKKKRDFGYLAVSGAAMGVGWIFLYEAYGRIGVSVATLAYYCGPVIVMAVTPLVFHEKIPAMKWLGFLSVVTGMFFVNEKALVLGGLSWGLLCGILSAVMFALMVIFNKKATGITGLENATWQLTFSFLTVGVFTLMRQGAAFHIPTQSILPILLLGIVNTGIGCYLYFSSISLLPAQSVAMWGYLEPVSALVFSAICLNERLTPVQFIGTALILGGAAFGEFYSRKRKRSLKNEGAV